MGSVHQTSAITDYSRDSGLRKLLDSIGKESEASIDLVTRQC